MYPMCCWISMSTHQSWFKHTLPPRKLLWTSPNCKFHLISIKFGLDFLTRFSFIKNISFQFVPCCSLSLQRLIVKSKRKTTLKAYIYQKFNIYLRKNIVTFLSFHLKRVPTHHRRVTSVHQDTTVQTAVLRTVDERPVTWDHTVLEDKALASDVKLDLLVQILLLIWW